MIEAVLTSGDKRVASLSQDLHEVVSEVTASQVQTLDSMGQSITFIDGYVVGDTISRVQDDTYEAKIKLLKLQRGSHV